MSRAIHPAAAIWPMLPDEELRALADSISEVGLLEPIVVTPNGDELAAILDGRNRLAACELAGVEPRFVIYDGDPTAYVLARNVARRHMTTGARAMATAVVLVSAGRRRDGRWAYGAHVESPESGQSATTWRNAMGQAGVVLDVTPEAAPAVIAGAVSLHAAHADAVKAREAAESKEARFARLPADLAEHVREERMSLEDAEAARDARDRRAADERRDARALLTRILDLTAPAEPTLDFAEAWAKHLGELEPPLVQRIDDAIGILTELRKRVDA